MFNLELYVNGHSAWTHLQQFSFGLRNALPGSLNEHFILFDLFPVLSVAVLDLAVLSGAPGESDLDVILFLKTDDILSALTNQRRVILAGDLEQFTGFIGLVRADVTRRMLAIM